MTEFYRIERDKDMIESGGMRVMNRKAILGFWL